MKFAALFVSLCLLLSVAPQLPMRAEETIPGREETLSIIRKVNDTWIKNNPDPGEPTAYTNEKPPRSNPDNGWALSVYFLGNMDAYEATGEQAYLDYAWQWAQKYGWKCVTDPSGVSDNANSQCCFATFLDLYQIDPARADLSGVKKNLKAQLAKKKSDAWSWVDALFMAAGTYGKMYRVTGDRQYLDKFHALYENAMLQRQLYDESEGLWYRDAAFFYPAYQTKVKGTKEFWSRGNGWAFGATAIILHYLPMDDPYRQRYINVLQNMAQALRETQGEDGLWRASLLDSQEVPNPETSGTALFTYGLAAGVNNGWLDASYADTAVKAWNGMLQTALRQDGFIGYAQPGGNQPYQASKDSINCFTTGAFLMAGNQIAMLEQNAIWNGSNPQGTVSVLVNGSAPSFDTAPCIVDGRTLVPMRAIFEALGAQVEWDAGSRTATGTKAGNTVVLSIGKDQAKVNGKSVGLDVPACLIDNRTFVPLRFLAEGLQAKVDWYDKTKTVVVTSVPPALTHDKMTVSNETKRQEANANPAQLKGKALTGGKITGTQDKSPGQAAFVPENVLDGNLETRWSCRGTDGEAFLVYELPEVKKISAVTVAYYQGTTRKSYFDILLSTDGINWKTVLQGQSSGKTNEAEAYQFPETSARFIKLAGYGNAGSDWNSVTEFMVFGQ